MSFPYNAYVLAFLGAGLTTFLSLPLWRAWCQRTGLVDDPGHRKIHDQPIALAGGLAVLTGCLVPIVAGLVALKFEVLSVKTVDPLSYGFGRRGLELGAILVGAIGMVFLGWLDDKHELKPAIKFAGQLLIAGLVAAAGVRIKLFMQNSVCIYGITILWILTVTNAFNFMDNMNGLCTGVGAIGAAYFATTAGLHGQYLVASLALLICGALAGFLPHNYPKATAFLGDAGSHLTGFLLAVLAILPHFYTKTHPDKFAVMSPLLILAVPLGDLVWVVILRWRLGQPFYVGDNNHLSHRLVRRGMSKPAAVALIWLIAAAIGGMALWL